MRDILCAFGVHGWLSLGPRSRMCRYCSAYQELEGGTGSLHNFPDERWVDAEAAPWREAEIAEAIREFFDKQLPLVDQGRARRR